LIGPIAAQLQPCLCQPLYFSLCLPPSFALNFQRNPLSTNNGRSTGTILTAETLVATYNTFTSELALLIARGPWLWAQYQHVGI